MRSRCFVWGCWRSGVSLWRLWREQVTDDFWRSEQSMREGLPAINLLMHCRHSTCYSGLIIGLTWMPAFIIVTYLTNATWRCAVGSGVMLWRLLSHCYGINEPSKTPLTNPAGPQKGLLRRACLLGSVVLASPSDQALSRKSRRNAALSDGHLVLSCSFQPHAK